jgi:hypothetical protein
MSYIVKWLKGDQLLSESRFPDMASAKDYAASRFPIERIRHGATAVEVRDDYGVLYLRL